VLAGCAYYLHLENAQKHLQKGVPKKVYALDLPRDTILEVPGRQFGPLEVPEGCILPNKFMLKLREADVYEAPYCM
jgi:hypothetical protein